MERPMLTNQTSSGSVASQTSQTLSETSANSESENSVSIKSEDKDQMAALFSAIPSVSEFCTQLFRISTDNSSIESMVAYNEAYHMIISQIPSEVEIVLDIIARTGILPYPWPLLKSAIGFRILQLCYLSVKKRGFAPSESMPTPFEMRVYTIICWWDAFEDDAPFTLQRLCELLTPYPDSNGDTSDNRHEKQDSDESLLFSALSENGSTFKLLNALDKVVSNVEGTHEDGEGDTTFIMHSDEMFANTQHQQNTQSSEDSDSEDNADDDLKGTACGHNTEGNGGGKINGNVDPRGDEEKEVDDTGVRDPKTSGEKRSNEGHLEESRTGKTQKIDASVFIEQPDQSHMQPSGSEI